MHVRVHWDAALLPGPFQKKTSPNGGEEPLERKTQRLGHLRQSRNALLNLAEK